ncbi:HEAT repeat domain-containing protein [uncultured Streptomyces sp.]|uniref:HEAT repeat domain-containing protein n=1 Tax=uncultured Streptomyces sp. TaxID=174707 RepID=UPI0026171975|nr:HEAT repeat domain-containing protein [uncultured Streptomyces sp.]
MLIGEVARRAGVSARMLRHYEALGLVSPSGRTGSGYREYSGEDIRRIFHIESLRSLGLTLREIGRALDDPGFTPTALVGDLIDRTRERIAAETELLHRLGRIAAADPAGWEDALHVVALLHALRSTSAGVRQRAALSSGDEVPAEALVEAVLAEADPHVAGALRWALARSGDDPTALLAAGLDSPEAVVRERAVRALAGMPGPAAAGALHNALAHTDPAVRRYAAPALGARGVVEALPALVDMIAAGENDIDAADALGVLAGPAGPDGDGAPDCGADAAADRPAATLVERLAHETDAAARGRLTQALGSVPGAGAARALRELSRDEDPAVAMTAAYLLRLREAT